MKKLINALVVFFSVTAVLAQQDTVDYATESEKAFAKAYELSVTPDTIQLSVEIQTNKKVKVETDKYAYEVNRIAAKVWQENTCKCKPVADSIESDKFDMRIILDGVKTMSEFTLNPATVVGVNYAQSVALAVNYWQEREYEPHPEDELSFIRVEYAVVTEKLRRNFNMPAWSTSEEIWERMKRVVEEEKRSEAIFRVTLWSDNDITFLEEVRNPLLDIEGMATTVFALWDSLRSNKEPIYQNGQIFILGKCTVRVYFYEDKFEKVDLKNELPAPCDELIKKIPIAIQGWYKWKQRVVFEPNQ